MFTHRMKINRQQMVLTAAQMRQLVKNHENRKPAEEARPVVKFFDPCGAATWILTELDPEDGVAYGLCDLGQGYPELGYVSLIEMCSIGRINRDLWFDGSKKTLAEWLEVAKTSGLVGV
jgi:hypothetical protein